MSGKNKIQINIKLNKKTIILIISIAIILSSVLIAMFMYTQYQPLTNYNYNGLILNFRADLREAKKLPVYPNESYITDILWLPFIENITIIYKNSTDMGLVGVEAFEIAYKLNIGYQMANHPIHIEAQEVKSFDSLPQNNPYVVLIPPSSTNETRIEVDENLIIIRGKTTEEFDLAVEKFLIVALGIKGIE